MVVVGIETSCDETGVALVEIDPHTARATVRAELLSSQIALHQLYGGVVPELAAREHMRSLPLLLEQLCVESSLSLQEIDAIGVTCGPGLKGCLLIGVTFAQGISAVLGARVPLVPVNHIEGHILSAELHTPDLKPPYLALVVSGGHTELVLVEGLGRYSVLCRTRDDAAGEAFDKSANLLDLPYPGGARLAELASAAQGAGRFTLPKVAREMRDFSFSGLKTAVLLMVERNRDAILHDPHTRAEVCWAIQDAIIETLVHKVVPQVRARQIPLVVCGGVSANKELRARLTASVRDVHFPPLRHCVDNGAMIAYVAARYQQAGMPPPALNLYSRWPVEQLAAPRSAPGACNR
jgi:N6-L-threonylcarbamoyladenine synthase